MPKAVPVPKVNIDSTVGIPQPSDSKKAPEDDPLLSVVVNDFEAARKYVKSNYLDNWQEYWQCYNNMRTRRGYEGVSDDFVPETFTIIETLKANIAGGKPRFNFRPLSEEQKQDTAILNNLMDYYWECNRMNQKTLNWVQDMLICGTGVLYVCWENDKPRIQNIPLEDFFVDPSATHLNNPDEPGYAKFAGYRYLADLKDLQDAKLVDPDTGKMTDKFTGLDDLPELSSDWEDLDKDAKEKFLGSTLGRDANKKQVECIVYFTKKKKIIVANRRKVIYSAKNPYYRTEKTRTEVLDIDGTPTKTKRKIPEVKSFLPFAILRNYVDSSLFYAKGDIAQIIDRQETLNDLTNQKHDNVTFVLNNMWQIDPQYSHLAEQIESIPGAVYPIPLGALQPLEKQIITGEVDGEIQAIKDEMRAATAADEVVQGISQNQGRITATEVTAQVNQANQRFTTKLNMLESEGYAQLGRIMFNMVQIFVDQPMAVRIIGQEGTQWKDFDPNDYSGDYEPKVELQSTTKAVKAEEGQKYLALHQIIANNPLVNQKEFLQIYMEKVYDFSEMEIKRLMDVPAPDPNAPSQPEPPKISVSLSGQLSPDVEATLLEQAGIKIPHIDTHLAALRAGEPLPPDMSPVEPSPPAPIPSAIPEGAAA